MRTKIIYIKTSTPGINKMPETGYISYAEKEPVLIKEYYLHPPKQLSLWDQK